MYMYMYMYVYICVSKFSLTFPIVKYFIRKNNIIILMQYNQSENTWATCLYLFNYSKLYNPDMIV